MTSPLILPRYSVAHDDAEKIANLIGQEHLFRSVRIIRMDPGSSIPRGSSWMNGLAWILIKISCLIFTVRNEVAKVMFLHVCVWPHGGVPEQVHPKGPGTLPQTRYTSPGPGTPPWTRYTTSPRTRYTPSPWDQVHSPQDQVHTPGTRYTSQDQVHSPDQVHTQLPSPGDGYCCGRYASYWNAFLFSYLFLLIRDVSIVIIAFRSLRPTLNRQSYEVNDKLHVL